MDEEYWLDKADVWIENKIKGDYNDGRESKVNGKIVKTRNWITRMDGKLDEGTKSKESFNGSVKEWMRDGFISPPMCQQYLIFKV